MSSKAKYFVSKAHEEDNLKSDHPQKNPDASTIVRQINTTLENNGHNSQILRQLVYLLDNRRVFKQLHCRSLTECLKRYVAEKNSISYLQRQAKAARIEALLRPGSPIGEIKEGVLREIGKLKNAADQLAVWKLTLAKKNGDSPCPTAARVRDAVKNAVIHGAEVADPRALHALEQSFDQAIDVLKKSFSAKANKLIASQPEGNEIPINLMSVVRKACSELYREFDDRPKHAKPHIERRLVTKRKAISTCSIDLPTRYHYPAKDALHAIRPLSLRFL